MILDLLIALSCGGVGMACGWMMHALYRMHEAQYVVSVRDGMELKSISSTTPVVAVAPSNASVSPEKVSAVADRVRNFAFSIAADVDAHQTQIQAVNTTLGESDLSNSPPVIVEAVEHLLQANETMQNQLEEAQQRIHQQSKQLQSAEQRAHTDALTQISNRGAFNQHLQERHQRGGARAGVLALLDVDHFKSFNDTHGHRVGDEVLRVVARTLEARLQPHGMVARYGGEEFVVLLHESNFEEAIALLEKSRQAIGTREIRFENKRLSVTMSMGIGRLETDQTSNQWLQEVDDALYRSKEAGRDCAHYLKDGEKILVEHQTQPVITNAGSTTNPAETTATSGRAMAAEPLGGELDLATSVSKLAAEANQTVQSGASNLDSESEAVAVPSKSANETSGLSTSSYAPSSANSVDASSDARELIASLSSANEDDRPQSLRYLPDRSTMVETLLELNHEASGSAVADATNHLMAVKLSGRPSGAILRSLLQLVRAATRSHDRIGCLDKSTLFVCLPEIQSADAQQRAEQIAAAVGSIGVNLASAEKRGGGERLSIGLVSLPAVDADAMANIDLLDVDQIQRAIAAIEQTQQVAEVAAGQSVEQSKLPILLQAFEEAVA